ncbi:MAG TPA: Gldg family protein [Lacipirellulaceae bacterium]|nr:Gldg family protein [Lacipirellulaceae bacterium]
MNGTVLKAIFRRDFVSYFSNPTGYVFICVFVMLSALAAFWPPDFFSNNLANLDQLNLWLPFILLVYIPAITMSIWAEERRQHTDELLLTLPASDVDVVVGKYLASVAIYTVALLFSMFSIYLVFMYGLGTPDTGLFIGNYIGYWFIGLAMLSVGMVASFLTSNLTVGFILGMIFIAPLAMFGVADWIIKNPVAAQALKRWSAVEQFRDFERGVVSLSGIVYFVMIAVIMLYISMVLIGRRHWGGREEDESVWWHYTARVFGLVALAIGLNLTLSHHNLWWADVTSDRINKTSASTVKLINDLRNDANVKTIKIDAYVSPEVPAEYAGHKLSFLSTLNELSSLSGGKIVVDVHNIENFSEEASNAEKQYGIEPREVVTLDRGAHKKEEIYLGAAFSSGLDRVVIPFIDKGIPVEYELVRSICTVAQKKRKRLGVLKTDVQLFGGFSMQGPTEESKLVSELKKQYDVQEVDPSKPIKDKYDVVLAIQPSSLSPDAMKNFVAMVKSGQPTAVFEDPFPWPPGGDVVGTAQPKRPPGGMMGMFGGGPPAPKGDISELWKLLGVEMYGDEVVWQDYNPEPKMGNILLPEFVFVDQGLTADGTNHPFDPDDPISSGMRQVLFLWPGSFRPADNSKLNFEKLAVTGRKTGTVSYQELEMGLRSGNLAGINRVTTREPYIIAAHITGNVTSDADIYLSDKDKKKEGKADNSAAAAKNGKAATAANKDKSKAKQAEDDALAGKEPVKTPVNVVLVADIDWILAPDIYRIREAGQDSDNPNDINFKFQNIPFALNILDSLAGDKSFIDLRKRTRTHRTLAKIEEATEEQSKAALDEQTKFKNDAKRQIDAARDEFRKKIADLENRTDLDPRAKAQMLEEARIRLENNLNAEIASLERTRNQEVKESERKLVATVRGVQDRYKLLAVLLPPIPPILLAFFVFFHRRKAEQEGVDTRRLRFGRVPDKEDAKAASVK